MDWRGFLKPNWGKIIIVISLFILSLFIGFFQESGCSPDSYGFEVCLKCGVIGVFNPLLRPVSFVVGNLIVGLMDHGNIRLCGASILYLALLPLDMIYWYLLSSLIYSFIIQSKVIKGKPVASMNRKRLVEVLVIVIFFSVISLLVKQPPTMIKYLYNKDEYYLETAVSRQDPSICDRFHDPWHKDWCYEEVGIAKEDPSICDKIQREGFKARCYRHVGIAKQDPSVCDRIRIQGEYMADMVQHMKDECYEKVGIAKEDPSICDEIQDYDRRYWCHFVVKEDPSICDKFRSLYYKGLCYKKVEAKK